MPSFRLGQWVKFGDQVGVHVGPHSVRDPKTGKRRPTGKAEVHLVDPETGETVEELGVDASMLSADVAHEDIPARRRPERPHPLYPRRNRALADAEPGYVEKIAAAAKREA